MTKQEIKDALWRIDEATELLTAEISRETGLAWKASVESGYGDFQNHVKLARATASRLHDILWKAESEIYKD